MKLLRFYNVLGEEVGWLYAVGRTDAECYEAARVAREEWRRKGIRV